MPRVFKPQVTHNFPALTLPTRSSSYFIYRTQLSIVAHQITTNLYCAATVKGKWSEVEHTMHTIDQHLNAWASNLPTEFNISFEIDSKANISDPYTLSRTGLAISYNFSRMILFRPCLCRIKGRMSDQSVASKTFIQRCAQECLQSARRTIALLTSYSASPSLLYTIPPFWNTLHCLYEALSVLTLELAFKGLHSPNDIGEILADSKRGVNWLSLMAAQSISARKAWEIFDGLIRLVAPVIGLSVFDMPTEAPVPPGCNTIRCNAADQIAISEETGLENLATEGPLTYLDTVSTISPPGWGNRGPVGYSSFDATSAPPNASELLHIASNQLNTSTITERFFTIGQLHGHFDEPWQHIFDGSNQHTSMSMVAPDIAMMAEVAGQASGQVQGTQLPMVFDQSAATAYDLGHADIYGEYPPHYQQQS